MEEGRTTQRLEWRYENASPSNAQPALRVILHYQFTREGNKWVGTCLELSTSTYARSKRKTEEALYELVLEHLNLLEESGERPRFFDEWGIKLVIPPVESDPTAARPEADRTHQTVLGFELEMVGIGS